MISYPSAMCLMFSGLALVNVLDLGFSSSEDWPRSRSESLPKRVASILILIALATCSGIAAFHSADASKCCCSCHCQNKEASK